MSQKNSKRMGLNLNLQKTTVTSNVDKLNFISDSEDISTVTNCMFLVVITNEVIKKRISWSRAATANLTKIIKNLEVSKTQN
jgi:hypothetical protein